MELRLDRASAAVMELSAALDRYEDAQEAIASLEAYYGSDEWRKDFADDEAGRLPQDLKEVYFQRMPYGTYFQITAT